MAEVIYFRSPLQRSNTTAQAPQWPVAAAPGAAGPQQNGGSPPRRRPATAPVAGTTDAAGPLNPAASANQPQRHVYMDDRYPGNPRQHPFYNDAVHQFPPNPWHGIVDTPPPYRPLPYGPKILRDLENPNRISVDPDAFLRKESGHSVWYRVRKAQYLKRQPQHHGWAPPFTPGNQGMVIPDPSTPPAPSATTFRHLFDLGTLDFIALRHGSSNSVVWGRWARRGAYAWGEAPAEIELSKWLPIFVGGLTERQEPYRFFAIEGTKGLVREAGGRLHEIAADVVPGLHSALATRDPTIVALTVEIMILMLDTDPLVSPAWLPHLWQFCQALNLYYGKRLKVDLGYGRRRIIILSDLVNELLQKAARHAGSSEALWIIKRYVPVYDGGVEHTVRNPNAAVDIKPFTLI